LSDQKENRNFRVASSDAVGFVDDDVGIIENFKYAVSVCES